MACFRQWKDLVAVVTGGASGLGQATVKNLISKGAKVIICDLPTSNGESIAKDLGNNCVFSSTDITSEDEVQNMFQMIKDKFKRLDLTVNCAAIARAYQVYNFNTNVSHKLEDFHDTLNVNVIGTFNILRLAAGMMGKNTPDTNGQRGLIINTSSICAFDGEIGQSAYSASSGVNVIGTFNILRLAAGMMGKNTPDTNGQRGLIINTSSICAFDGEIGQSAYSASSGAINAMTLPIARDLSTQGIRCCTVAPGLFRTPLLNVPEKIISFLSETICFPNRPGLPEEFAHLVQYIVENPMINGEVIRLDGGLRLIS
ncbi:3-hydroxyacyl-CoA dehydrogenase type-2-like [Centruroides sculpturatus]|uniref:3-hydroxyacyl-CoA dehydrogenase type-2-like n=1 Tax=Centruroides sculpturatus TaxID=218467 RepID=UPI000C6D81E9|nr:3-hydroxyacyl-CoA dehydrogenase type-2-like [Centruroides sculpturatus]